MRLKFDKNTYQLQVFNLIKDYPGNEKYINAEDLIEDICKYIINIKQDSKIKMISKRVVSRLLKPEAKKGKKYDAAVYEIEKVWIAMVHPKLRGKHLANRYYAYSNINKLISESSKDRIIYVLINTSDWWKQKISNDINFGFVLRNFFKMEDQLKNNDNLKKKVTVYLMSDMSTTKTPEDYPDLEIVMEKVEFE